MNDIPDQLARLGRDDDGQRQTAQLLTAWAAVGEPSFRRAGTLRGLAALGHVLWAAGLGLAAQAALRSQLQGVALAPVLTGAALVAAGLLLRAFLLSVADRVADDGAAAVQDHLRARLLRAALPTTGAPPEKVSDAALGEALDSEVSRLTGWLTTYVPARRAMLLGSGIVLASILVGSWPVALMLVLATPLLPFNLKVIGMGTRAAVHAQLTATRTLSTRLLDRLRGLPTLVGLGAGEEAVRATEADDRELAARTGTVLRVAFLSTAWIELLIAVAMAVVATYCGLALLGYLDLPVVPSTMSLGSALFVLVLTPAYFAPARELARGYHARAEAAAAAELITEIIDTAPVAPVGGLVANVPAACGPSWPSPAGVVMEAVEVRHPGRHEAALDDITLTVRPGSVMAISGPSGAGKTTLLSVAAGLRSPDRGRCLHTVGFDTLPATPTVTAWAGQPSYLLPGTLRDNLLLARRDADDEQLTAAFAALGFEDLLAALPQGLATQVGERGWGLSSGQMQQLVLVRVLLRDTPLLCLDEPTAHLDPNGEARVIGAIQALARSRTIVVTTHSPALLEIADDVVRLSRGRVAGIEGALL
ncbi:ATP-binding cassette, subfamily C, CydD [Saccharopolyspora shandongensis]|uniref:ATP-binding cassette, subfamily C, CydD n=1 Tax=Saccharopolyspora shandongensis TaxID=418495 RepID=A0A1H3U7P5_9PSEU|nr:ATP-binding cassette domain-containing protein [Saccharopolyspora shandongensis]SDZ58523.1 ATP-binding cassette, subfamily C, CydD [Saccharopolyspora shandongensis]